LENLEERDHLNALGVDGAIELKWNKGREWECGLDLSGLWLGEVAGCCEQSHESSVSIKCGEFLD